MKRFLLELWVSDEAADEMKADVLEDGADFVDGEKILGARFTLPDGNVHRFGQTFG